MGRALVRTKVWPAPVQSCTHAFSVASPQCHIFSCIVNYLQECRGVGIRLALERLQDRKVYAKPVQDGHRPAARHRC
jgi:hypothetical protein